MYHLKVEKQMHNVRSMRMPTPTGLLVGNKNSLKLLQPQDNMQPMLDKATSTSGRKHP
jgi:hypothetical protein